MTGPRGQQCAHPGVRCIGKFLSELRQHGAGGGMGEAWASRRRLEFGNIWNTAHCSSTQHRIAASAQCG